MHSLFDFLATNVCNVFVSFPCMYPENKSMNSYSYGNPLRPGLCNNVLFIIEVVGCIIHVNKMFT